MLKKYISRESDIEVNVVSTNSKDSATVAVAGVIRQDVDPQLGVAPDIESYHHKEGSATSS